MTAGEGQKAPFPNSTHTRFARIDTRGALSRAPGSPDTLYRLEPDLRLWGGLIAWGPEGKIMGVARGCAGEAHTTG